MPPMADPRAMVVAVVEEVRAMATMSDGPSTRLGMEAFLAALKNDEESSARQRKGKSSRPARALHQEESQRQEGTHQISRDHDLLSAEAISKDPGQRSENE